MAPASPSPAGNSSQYHLPSENLSLFPLTHGPPENLDLSSVRWLLCVDLVQGWKKSTRDTASACSSYFVGGRSGSPPLLAASLRWERSRFLCQDELCTPPTLITWGTSKW